MPKPGTEKSNIQFRDQRERELYETAMLGEAARQFILNDKIGMYLHERAKIIIRQAEVDALAVDPDGWRGWLHGKRKLRQIRNQADVARMFIKFVGDAFLEGQQAEKELLDDQ